MISALALSAALAAAPPPPAVQVAFSGFTVVDVPAERATFFADFLARSLAEDPALSVVTPSEIQTLIGLERQRQLLGCADASTECLAELAGALGAKVVVAGSIGRFGSGYAVTVKALRATNGSSLFSATERVSGDDALLDWLGRTSRALGDAIRAQFGLPPRALPGPGAARYVAAGASALALVAGGGALLAASGVERSLTSGTAAVVQAGDLEAVANRGRTFQAIGWTALGLGAAGAVVTALLWSRPSSPQLSVGVDSGGAVRVSLEGAF